MVRPRVNARGRLDTPLLHPSPTKDGTLHTPFCLGTHFSNSWKASQDTSYLDRNTQHYTSDTGQNHGIGNMIHDCGDNEATTPFFR